MTELNRGKQFEAKFKEDFKRSFPERGQSRNKSERDLYYRRNEHPEMDI